MPIKYSFLMLIIFKSLVFASDVQYFIKPKNTSIFADSKLTKLCSMQFSQPILKKLNPLASKWKVKSSEADKSALVNFRFFQIYEKLAQKSKTKISKSYLDLFAANKRLLTSSLALFQYPEMQILKMPHLFHLQLHSDSTNVAFPAHSISMLIAFIQTDYFIQKLMKDSDAIDMDMDKLSKLTSHEQKIKLAIESYIQLINQMTQISMSYFLVSNSSLITAFDHKLSFSFFKSGSIPKDIREAMGLKNSDLPTSVQEIFMSGNQKKTLNILTNLENSIDAASENLSMSSLLQESDRHSMAERDYSHMSIGVHSQDTELLNYVLNELIRILSFSPMQKD